MRNTAIKRIQNQDVKKAQIHNLPLHKSKQKNKACFVKIACSLALLAVVVCNLTLRSEILRVKNDIAAADKKISELNSEEKRMNMEYENMISYKNLEIEAQKIGMCKASKDQIHYIDLKRTDHAEIITKKIKDSSN